MSLSKLDKKKTKHSIVARKSKRQIDRCDELFSEITRRRYYADGEVACEYCGTRFYDRTKETGDLFPAWMCLETSHYIGRAYFAVRWDPDNVAALCNTCHRVMGNFPGEHDEFFIKRIGSDRVEQLVIRARSYSKKDLDIVEADLQERIRLLNET